MTTNCYYRYSW